MGWENRRRRQAWQTQAGVSHEAWSTSHKVRTHRLKGGRDGGCHAPVEGGSLLDHTVAIQAQHLDCHSLIPAVRSQRAGDHLAERTRPEQLLGIGNVKSVRIEGKRQLPPPLFDGVAQRNVVDERGRVQRHAGHRRDWIARQSLQDCRALICSAAVGRLAVGRGEKRGVSAPTVSSRSWCSECGRWQGLGSPDGGSAAYRSCDRPGRTPGGPSPRA